MQSDAQWMSMLVIELMQAKCMSSNKIWCGQCPLGVKSFDDATLKLEFPVTCIEDDECNMGVLKSASCVNDCGERNKNGCMIQMAHEMLCES